MNVASTSLQEFLSQVRAVFDGGNPEKYVNEEPLRAELFSSEQMDNYAQALAKSHKLNQRHTPDRLLKRLADNEKILLEVRNLLTKSAREDYQITPAGEWLLDNFYLVEDHVRIAKKHFPRKYSEALPQLAEGPAAGLPRIYAIALEIISHSDGHIDVDSTSNFIHAYEKITNLQIGELWAVPIMLRLALIENLRRVSTRLAIDRIHRNQADHWAKQLINTAEHNPRDLILVLADMARANPQLVQSFVAEFTRQLRRRGAAFAQTLTWLEERLAENGQTSEDLVQAENQKQAADQVSVSNSIGSLRLLGAIDWQKFFEKHSVVEQILREDPVYGRMDFSTRDQYRHVVEAIAKNSTVTEWDVARIAVQLAADKRNNNDTDERETHVGYYLIGPARNETEAQAKMKAPLGERIRRTFGKHPLLVYTGSMLIITLGVSARITFILDTSRESYWLFILVGALSLICVSQLAVALVNFIATLVVRPVLLPRMDFSEEIPHDARTLVVIPTLLTSAPDIEELAEALEVRFLANKREHLHFGLLTDFTDAAEKELPGDEHLLDTVRKKINELNDKYKREGENIFFLFHRPRQWNKTEKKWIGYERKRGKLLELNTFLRDEGMGGFSVVLGDTSILPEIKYVITLDTDTQLPRDAAWKMIGTMAHPLNRAYYDENKKRVTKGYGILQPRVMVSLPETDSSAYAWMNSNEPGIDPYTRAISDVYQDLFAEGSFIGKGIYEVDIFEKSLKNKFPENRILSHDLLEGCYARSGLMSDIMLYEKYPERYMQDIRRRHRWIRGDWQIAAWISPFVPGADRHWYRNTLSALSRWKIFDNIRRSLVPIALTAFIILGWTLLPVAPVWTLVITGIIIVPSLFVALWDLFRKPNDVIFIHHLIISGRSAGNAAIATLFTAICLPFEAFVNLDAILRTTWRILISHRHLLEWNTDSSVKRSIRTSLGSYYVRLVPEPMLAAAVAVYLFAYIPYNLYAAGPVLILWLFAPVITWRVSTRGMRESLALTPSQDIFLQKLARKTWSFFERIVSQEDNWLPPDNFQEEPVELLAHRTSPTNIGLSFLSNLAALDFGYITVGQLLARSGNTIASMQKMERYRGHFYNWYDTQTLRPLYPGYISSVDSGNLAGHLLTFRQGILSLSHRTVVSEKWFEGLRSTLLVLLDLAGKNDTAPLKKFISQLEAAHPGKSITLHTLEKFLTQAAADYNNIITQLDSDGETGWWKQRFADQLKDLLDELHTLTPWLDLPGIADKLNEAGNITGIPRLRELAEINDFLMGEVQRLKTENIPVDIAAFEAAVNESVRNVSNRLKTVDEMAQQCYALADMEWDFLYDKSKKLLTIGYNTEDHRNDSSYYDLLASEARLSTFVGIAQGWLPQECWFSLGRLMTNVDNHPTLLSWSGSMFEYLMPELVMPTYSGTLLNRTDIEAVRKQISYGKQRGVPWGISECCYNQVDAGQSYQYRAFGVPGLGLNRGLGEDLVIAPYATMLALMMAPEKAVQNLQQMAKEGFEGVYGFYDAVDYTPSRVPPGQTNVVVSTYMAHHQGMGLLSLAYVLLDQPMQKYFEAEPQFQATLLLLQERIPKITSSYAHTSQISEIHARVTEPALRIIKTPNTPAPEVQLLSNGNYHVMVTNAGGGYSRWRNLAVTRWREDCTCDNWGSFCYLRDLDSGAFWSTAHQPTLARADNYEAVFSQGRADIRLLQNGIESHTEIVVSPEDDIEMRRIHITNRSGRRKNLDITSYAEVVIGVAADDASHPAFNNLFIQTELLPAQQAILCTRRPRSAGEKPPWMFHLVKLHGVEVREISYETDRMQFLGRGNTVANPDAMHRKGKLSNSQGPVLDPIVSIRQQLIFEPEETIIMDVIIGMGETREVCEGLINKYQDKYHKDRIFELAWTHNQVVLRQMNVSEGEAQLYTRLAGSVIYLNPALRADAASLVKNRKGQPGLWPYSISGDLPIVLLKIADGTSIELVRQLAQAHVFWRLKGLIVDLVIWNEGYGGYRQQLQNQIMALFATQPKDQPGGVFIRSSEQISNEDRVLFQTVARIHIVDDGSSLDDHANRKALKKMIVPYRVSTQPYQPVATPLPAPEQLTFFNGLGGFSTDGKEYVIQIKDKKMPPAPWVNVIANANFGTIVSEGGQGYTWSENAHEFRLTPWSDDPASDHGGEAFYIRDEETGYYWSPAPLPKTGKSGYSVRHGFGYSVFECLEDGIHSEMWVYVDVEAPVKFVVLRLKNKSGRSRKLSATGYIETVLGELRYKSAMYIISEQDSETGALFSRNPYNTEFPDRVMFFDTDETIKTFTGDRTEFIGRNHSLGNPDGMARIKLSNKIRVGRDPCSAIQTYFDLFDDQEREVVFKIGAGKNEEDARNLVLRFRGIDKVTAALEKVKNQWDDITGALKIETPDTATNLIANGWLIYQALSCRVWGRSGFYQSGGAFGFRDQLQDVMSLLFAAPQLARQQILLSASRQFKEGDVQHWWHPPMGRGVRTLCSDDYLWLPFVTAKYISHTGDMGILDEAVRFLDGRPLNPGEDSYYDLPGVSGQSASLYQHCLDAITHGFKFGEHGMPLMGIGDWNDGMDRVGKDGKGESVWLAFFLYDILNEFSKIARLRNDHDFAEECNKQAERLKQNTDQHAWDGQWYRRAYFDNGEPLGSALNPECQIDSIAQSWSVLSGAGGETNVLTAMESAYKRLVRKDASIILLLDPPFDKSSMDPGYIKGYVPGVRENGGQYTHAAVWLVMAFAKLGDRHRAWELLQMLNPVNHGRTPEEIEEYKVEPYVTAGDVYAVSPHTGMGGWTWYSGSAGWMYRLIIESVLGIKQEGGKLLIKPCMPPEWTSYKIHYRFGNTTYHITVSQDSKNDEIKLSVNGTEQENGVVTLKSEQDETVGVNSQQH